MHGCALCVAVKEGPVRFGEQQQILRIQVLGHAYGLPVRSNPPDILRAEPEAKWCEVSVFRARGRFAGATPVQTGALDTAVVGSPRRRRTSTVSLTRRHTHLAIPVPAQI